MTLQDGDPRSIGSYALEGRLGAGGMGVVYRARSLSGRQVAVKVIRPELAQDAGFRDRFRREVAAARQVSGAFTAPVVDADPDAPTPWLATLFVPGPSLAERIAGQGPLAPGEVLRLAAGLAEALRDIHRAGLVHRDLKPGNVLLADDGPRVIDFGISRASDGTQLTQTGTAVGTPPFMAPEQFTGAPVGPSADVFSLGSVLVHAATGHGPFDGDSMHTIGFRVVYEDPDLTSLPDELRSLVTSCLAKDPAQRPTVDQVLQTLGAAGPSDAVPPTVLSPQPTAPAGFGPPPTVQGAALGPRRIRLMRRPAVIAAAAALAAVAITVPVLVNQLGDDGKKSGTGTGPSPSSSASQGGGGPLNSSCAERSGMTRGAGSQTQQPAVNAWIRDYTTACPDQDMSYDGGGSGFGYMDFKGERADFAVLNKPMSAAESTWVDQRCGAGGAVQFPVTTMPVALVFHLEGVDSLTLSGRTIAQIYMGKITRWNDPQIVGLNPEVTLPDRTITLFHHHGQSESTQTLTEYLAGAAPDDWRYMPSISMPDLKSEAVPDEDIADKVTATDGSLAYAPMDIVTQAKLSAASLDTGAGKPVFPDAESLTEGAATADVVDPTRRDMAMKVAYDTTADNAYPVFRFGYAVVCAKHSSKTTPDVRPFLAHALSEKGQKTAAELGYGALPEPLTQKGLNLMNGRR